MSSMASRTRGQSVSNNNSSSKAIASSSAAAAAAASTPEKPLIDTVVAEREGVGNDKAKFFLTCNNLDLEELWGGSPDDGNNSNNEAATPLPEVKKKPLCTDAKFVRALVMSGKAVSNEAMECVVASLSSGNAFWAMSKANIDELVTTSSSTNSNDNMIISSKDAAALVKQQALLKAERWDGVKTTIPDTVASVLFEGDMLSDKQSQSAKVLGAFLASPVGPTFVGELANVRATTQESLVLWARAMRQLAFSDTARPGALLNAAVHDALVAQSMRATTRESVQMLARAMCSIASSDALRGMLGTATLRDCIMLKLLPIVATSPDAARWLSTAINNITVDHVANQKLFSTPAVRDALGKLMENSTTPEAAQWLSAAINNITSTENASKKLFATPQFRDALIELQEAATTPAAAQWYASAVCSLTALPETRVVLGVAPMRGALVRLLPLATTPEAVQWIATALNNITMDNAANRKLFATPAVRDGVVQMLTASGGGGATTPVAVRWVASALTSITTDDDAARKMFSSDAVRAALVKACDVAATHMDATHWVATAIGNLTATDEAIRRQFAVDAVRDALVKILSATTTPSTATTATTSAAAVASKQEVVAATPTEAVCACCGAMTNITSVADGAKVFGSSVAVRDALVKTAKLAGTAAEAARRWCAVIWNIIATNSASVAIFATDVVRAEVAAMRKRVAAMPKDADTAAAVERCDWISGALPASK